MRIKYLNLNIWMGLLFNRTLDFIKKQDADIVSLQEVMDAEGEGLSLQHQTKKILQEKCGYKYSAYMPLAFDERLKPPALFGNMILSKFPIRNSKEIFFDRPFIHWDGSLENENFPRGLLLAEIEANNRTIAVANIHGIWGRHGDDTERRLNMIDLVLSEINGKENVILSGDFNLNENIYPPIKTPNLKEVISKSKINVKEKKDNPVAGFNVRVNPEASVKVDLSKPGRTKCVSLLEEKLVNVFKDERISSFNPKYKDFQKTGFANAVVDMVFISPNIKVLSHSQPDVDVSDHMPQILDLQV